MGPGAHISHLVCLEAASNHSLEQWLLSLPSCDASYQCTDWGGSELCWWHWGPHLEDPQCFSTPLEGLRSWKTPRIIWVLKPKSALEKLKPWFWQQQQAERIRRNKNGHSIIPLGSANCGHRCWKVFVVPSCLHAQGFQGWLWASQLPHIASFCVH